MLCRICVFTLLLATVVFTTKPLPAESLFGTAMKEKYNLRSVSCFACHVKGEEKKVLNAFGKDFQKLTEGKDYSARIETAKNSGSDQRKEKTELLKKELLVLLKQLDKVEAPSGKSYSEAITAGEIEGIKLRD